MRCKVATTAFLLGLGCSEEQAPPGAGQPAPHQVVVRSRASASAPHGPSVPAEGQTLGTRDDNLPFEPQGEKLASIAWRTWIYTDTGPRRTRYGYLRAGAVVARRGPVIENAGCAGGWYRINPRGFVCLGKGATTDLEHPIVKMASVRPKRGQGLPYVYALAGSRPPHLYFKLPAPDEMKSVEGGSYLARAARWRASAERTGLMSLVGEPEPPPDFLRHGASLVKPYGVARPLRYSVHAGQASGDSGFSIGRVIEWHERLFGLTTEHDLIALDRTEIVRPSSFHGVELGEDADLPAAIVTKHWALRYEEAESGQLEPVGSYEYRQALDLVGKKRHTDGVTFYETEDGGFLPASSALVLERRDSFPSVATGSRKWIDISIRDQSLVAYEGKKAVYATLVSTGRGGLGDPEEVPATVRGTFMIHSKHISSTMDGEEDVSDSFNLRDVPFVQYFHKGYALHGTYWHDDFGKIRSHGCVNLSPIDSAWLFEWTDPRVPEGWHAALNKERGTVVYIHP